jgi:fibronectin type 3 domain-containing protein/photosystem II stability/assembly factor-like uncharacterized protein
MTTNKLLLLICISLMSRIAFAQWEPTSGPVGGPAYGIYRDGNRIVAFSSSGYVHESNDLGDSWAQKSTPSYAIMPTQIQKMWGKLYVTKGGYYNAGVLSSEDGGKTWTQNYIRPNSTSYYNQSISVVYRFGNVLLAGAQSNSYTEDIIHMSLDSGKTWTPRPGLGNPFKTYNGVISDFVAIGENIFAATSFGVYHTTDTGYIWSARNGAGFAGNNNIKSLVANGTTLYAVNINNASFVSTDSAKTWVQITGKSISSVYNHKGTILGVSNTADTLYAYNSGTSKWTAFSSDIKGNYTTALHPYGDTLYMGGRTGVYYSLNNGQNWTKCNGSIRGLNLFYDKPAVIGNTILVIDENKNVHASSDQGNTWNYTGSPFGATTSSTYSFFTQGGLLFSSIYNTNKMSADTGKTWTTVASSIPYLYEGISVGTTHYFTYANSLYSSVDSGKTVTNITNSIATGMTGINDIKRINGYMWVVSSQLGLYRSADNGATWTSSNSGLPSKYNTSTSKYDTSVVWLSNVGNVLVCRATDGSTEKNYISTNNGATWTFRSTAYFPKPTLVYNNLMLSSEYYSLDTLATYTSGFSTGITAPYVSNLRPATISGSYLYAANGTQGVWRRKLSSFVAPPAPINLTTSSTSQNNIRISWNRVANASYYAIHYRYYGSGSFSMTTTSDTTYMMSYVSAGNRYEYYIRAINEFGTSLSGDTVIGMSMEKPAIPQNTLATGISTSAIRLTWSPKSTTATKYYIEMGMASCCSFTLIDSVNVNDSAYVVGGLPRNAQRWFRIRCIDAGGYSDYTTAFSGRSNDTLPKSPVALQATAISQYAISLAWTDSSDNETKFIIERKDLVTGDFMIIDSVTTNYTSYTARGLTGSTKYHFRVSAKNSGGPSGYTNIDSAVTYPAPDAPTALTITGVTSSRVSLSWTDNSSSETGYVIERATSSTGTFLPYDSVSANVTSRNVTGLSELSRYYFRVKTKDAYGYSGYTNVVDTITLPNPPIAPDGLAAAGSSATSINLSWNDNSYNEAYFMIERSLSPSSGFSVIDSVSSNISWYTAQNLNPATYYYFRVRAKNAGGLSAYSNPAMGTTNMVAPPAPTQLKHDAIAEDWIRISWTDNSFNEERFILQRAEGSSGFGNLKTLDPGTVSTYDSTVVAGMVYTYRIYAQNSAGNSANSNELTVTIPEPKHSAPKNLLATAINHFTINLSWTDTVTGIERYIIERRTVSTSYTAIDSVSGGVFSYSDDELNPGINYAYRVRSFKNSSGYSDYSLDTAATTMDPPAGLPLAPSALTHSALSPTSVTLTWTDNSSDEDKFYIESNAGSGFTVTDSVDANITQYVHNGLTQNTTMNYRVRAKNAVGYSAFSNIYNVTTPFDFNAPTGLYTEILSPLSVKLFWTDRSTSETNFIIERSGTANDDFKRIATVDMNTTQYTDNLPGKGVYYYRVKAKRDNTLSAASNTAVAVTIAAGINDPSAQVVAVYPNPTAGQLFISCRSALTNVTLTDLLGKTHTVTATSSVQGSYEIDLSAVNAGVYVLVVQMEDGSAAAQRIVKQ